ncbi:hypothetical protein NOF04DRAFT_1342593 [Fusarium oxysporum II5]|nr:hypothetical protein NOF04DRAFT_1342593 [Fusarium oxysporum II5]
MQYSRDGTQAEKKDYAYFNQQYATSTYQVDHNMYPDLIVQPKGDEDVIKAVIWARENKVAVAVKSGGHQYSGASSTSGKNIQMDLSNTYKDLMVLNPHGPIDKDRALVYVDVSNQLKELNTYLKHNQLFVPHGDCAYVCVGGHGQTGGYGQLGRGFGLFGDHIRTIRIVCHNGAIRDISKENNFEFFYAILGGSPGNFGIISHYTVEVYQAKSYMGTIAGLNRFKGPHGIKGFWIYSPKCLPPNDFPIAMLFPLLNNASFWEHIQNKIKNALADEFLEWLNGRFPAVIIKDKYDESVDQWFNKFRALKSFFENETLLIDEFEEDMSRMTGRWILPRRREFDLPYVDSVIDRIDLIYNPHQLVDNNPGDKEYEVYTYCKLATQIHCYGGTLDCFHELGDKYKEYAERWQAKNDSVMVGPSSPFSKQDRRLLWGSYGDWDLGKQEYQKLGKARGKADPNGTFTANLFAVSAIETKGA